MSGTIGQIYWIHKDVRADTTFENSINIHASCSFLYRTYNMNKH